MGECGVAGKEPPPADAPPALDSRDCGTSNSTSTLVSKSDAARDAVSGRISLTSNAKGSPLMSTMSSSPTVSAV